MMMDRTCDVFLALIFFAMISLDLLDVVYNRTQQVRFEHVCTSGNGIGSYYVCV